LPPGAADARLRPNPAAAECMMKANRPFALAVLVMAMLAAPLPVRAQAASAPSFKTGYWVGSATFNGSTFSHCTITVGYTDNANLFLQLNAQMNFTIYGTRTDFNVDPSKTYDVTIEIDASYNKSHRATGRPGQRNAVLFNLGNDADFRQALAAGKKMTWVDSEGKKYPFDLTNIANAMRKLITCAALYGVD
jgi:hypothetical protein